MKVKQLIKELQDVDPELEVKMNITTEDGFYDCRGSSAKSGVKNITKWLDKVVLEGRDV